MKLFSFLAIWAASAAATAVCPNGCECDSSTLSCRSLPREVLVVALSVLRDPPYSEIDTLSIIGTANFSMDAIPALPNLRTLIIENCLDAEPMNLQKDLFPSVKRLVVHNSNVTGIAKSISFAFPALEELDFGNNQITTLGSASLHLPGVKKLVVMDNRIETLGVHVLRYMQELAEFDISGNKLTKLVTSDFSFATNLRVLNVSRNRINAIERDTTNQLPAIETLDLSRNNIGKIDGDELSNMERLVTLNLSGNWFRLVGQAFLKHPTIQILDLSMSSVWLVEAGAFSYLPLLHTVHLENNRDLVSLSHLAFQNSTIVFSLDVSNTSLRTIPPTLAAAVSRLRISGMRLDCACMLEHMDDLGAATVLDWDNATCITQKQIVHKLSQLTKAMLSADEECTLEVLTPMGDTQAVRVGNSYRMHCMGDLEDAEVYWVAPNNSAQLARPPELTTRLQRLDYFTKTLFAPEPAEVPMNRTHITTEYYGIDVALYNDSGDYECIWKNKGKTYTRTIKLLVLRPRIQLTATDISTTSVHLFWDSNLEVAAKDRVAMHIISSSPGKFMRAVQLPLYSTYLNYNLVGLVPDTDYFICLRWTLMREKTDIFSSCITVRTDAVKGFMESIGIEFIFGFVIFGLVVMLFCCGSCFHARFNLIVVAKRESKMAQSTSGQSMLSHSSADATMYENFQLQTSPTFEQNI